MSLLADPAIVVGLLLSRKRRAGPRFWAILAGGGAVFILAVHIGPAAGDTVASIPDQYTSPVADVTALGVLAGFFAALVAHCLYKARLAAWAPSPRADRSAARSTYDHKKARHLKGCRLTRHRRRHHPAFGGVA